MERNSDGCIDYLYLEVNTNETLLHFQQQTVNKKQPKWIMNPKLKSFSNLL